jgi:hypothetical protein
VGAQSLTARHRFIIVTLETFQARKAIFVVNARSFTLKRSCLRNGRDGIHDKDERVRRRLVAVIDRVNAHPSTSRNLPIVRALVTVETEIAVPVTVTVALTFSQLGRKGRLALVHELVDGRRGRGVISFLFVLLHKVALHFRFVVVAVVHEPMKLAIRTVSVDDRNGRITKDTNQFVLTVIIRKTTPLTDAQIGAILAQVHKIGGVGGGIARPRDSIVIVLVLADVFDFFAVPGVVLAAQVQRLDSSSGLQ